MRRLRGRGGMRETEGRALMVPSILRLRGVFKKRGGRAFRLEQKV